MSLTFNEKSHRYRMDGKPVSGVTTLLNGGVPKPQLIHWAARTVAEFVSANPEEVERLRHDPDTDFVKHLSGVPNRIRDAAADRGTEVHALAQRIINGLQVTVPDELRGYLDGYVQLIDDWDIQPVLTETSVGNKKHWYAGRLDSIATIGKLDGALCLVDWKTSNGIYGETALQCAAYARAEFYTTDEAPEVEVPLPQVERTLVAHITPNGAYLHDLSRTPAEIDEAFDEFLAAAFIHKTKKRRDARITNPLELPVTGSELKEAS